MKRMNLPSKETLRCFFEYDEKGYFIRKIKTGPTTFVGQKVFGTIHRFGYRIMKFQNRMFTVHRLVWQWHFGRTPKHLDHINRVREDNRIENLRKADPAQNGFNQKLHSRNTSGMRGLYFDKSRKYWVGAVQVYGRRIKLGHFKDKDKVVKKLKAYQQKNFGGFHARD